MTTATPADLMPPLPEPDSYCTHKDSHEYDVFSAEQMQAYATAHASALLSRAELAEQMVKELREAAEFLLGCFEPDRDVYVFSKRMALTKLRNAISNQTPGVTS